MFQRCLKTCARLLVLALAATVHAAELRVVTVNNGHMLTLQRLTPLFEQTHPDIHIKWVTLEEGQLRQELSRDIATGAGRYDVMTIGAYEAPLWARKGRLRPIEPTRSYRVDDLLPAIRQALSVDGTLYALPFYGESLMTLVRTDLLQAAHIHLDEPPTWEQIRLAARKLNAPDKGVYGICLRGKPGWGENMAILTTMVNSFGGQWFDMHWQPRLQSTAWQRATHLYAELLREDGPPGAAANGYNENLALFMDGHCAIWVDATVAGSFVNRPERSRVAGRVGFLPAPVALTSKGAHWLWTWALAIPSSSRQAAAAQTFIEWATSRDYVQLVADREGWDAVPSGTRRSTYANPAFQRANAYARIEQDAIASATPLSPTLPPSPYSGIQWVSIPEFQAIGTAVGQQISRLLQEPVSVDEVLKKSQQLTEQKMREAGYGAR